MWQIVTIAAKQAIKRGEAMDDTVFPGATQQGVDSAAEVLLKSMKVNGIDYMFVNPGTDFAPLIEGLAASKRKGAVIPNLMVIPHENWASFEDLPNVKPFRDMLKEAFGQAEADSIVEGFDSSVIHATSSIIEFRPDLSYLPEK